MATTRAFAYNPSLNPIPGTDSYGTLVIGTSNLDFSKDHGGIKWWMGPDETDGYVIGGVVPSGTHPSPVGDIGTVEFWRTENLTSENFISLANQISFQNFNSAGSAITWLNNNGYWTSYVNPEFRYYKLEILDTRVNGNGVQISEFVFISGGTDNPMTGVTMSNPNGASSNLSGTTGAYKIIDKSLASKWYDIQASGYPVLIFDFGTKKLFDGYKWGTGDDNINRDPRSWKIYGSNDNTSFTLLHEVNDYLSWSTRSRYNDRFYLSGYEPTRVVPTPILDTYSGASAAYSLRKLSSTYNGSAIRVRRSSDNAEQDIGFLNGELDTASLISFVGSVDGFVTNWYDQSGNGKDALQATQALQPQIISLGCLQESKNGYNGIYFNGANRLLTSSTIAISGDCSVFYVMRGNGTGTDGTIISNNNNRFEARPNQVAFGSGSFIGSSSQILDKLYFGNLGLNSALRKISGLSVIYVNNNQHGNTSNGTLSALGTSIYSIGNRQPDFATPLTGWISEIILYPKDLLSSFNSINSEINSYYSTY